jgi:hypothetical protein
MGERPRIYLTSLISIAYKVLPVGLLEGIMISKSYLKGKFAQSYLSDLQPTQQFPVLRFSIITERDVISV